MNTATRLIAAAIIAASLIGFTTQTITPVMPPRVEQASA